jgi:hypothetical protein
MRLARILWHIPERLVHSFVSIAGAFIEKVPSYKAKRIGYFLLYPPYIANHIMTIFWLRRTNASAYRKKAAPQAVHVSGPFFSRKKDDIFLGDLMNGVERKFHFSVTGKIPAVSFHDTPAVRLKVGKVSKVNGNISSFTVGMLPAEGSGRTAARVSIKSGKGAQRDIVFRIRSVRNPERIRKASIRRLKNGARFAFSWRLDWDHATSPEMLRRFFFLAEKWGIPPTIYVSGAVLDEKLYGEFIGKSFGKYVINDARKDMFGYESIPSAGEMLESKKLLGRYAFSPEIEFPIPKFTAEIGNHMFHHFGGPECSVAFKPHDVKMLEDDLKRNHELIGRALRTAPRTWSRPTSGEYPAGFLSALERLGYDSVCNYRYRMGMSNSPCLGIRRFGGLAEISSNYPRDPYFASDVTVLRSALECCNHSSGTGLHMTVSSHLGPPFVLKTTEMLESIFAKALESSSWICTVSSFVTYANNAGKIIVQSGERRITLKNPTAVTLKSVPVEIAYGDGSVDMVTADCPAGRSTVLKF